MTIHCSIDIEFNQPSEKIISVGGVIGELPSGQILEEFEYFIKIDEPISDFIVKLTDITNEITDQGITLQEAYQNLRDLRAKYNFVRNPLTWGGGDSLAIKNALGISDREFLFGRRWIDVKTIYQTWRLSQGLKVQAGLAKAMAKSGLQFQGTKHHAKDDARNTFLFYKFLLTKFNP